MKKAELKAIVVNVKAAHYDVYIGRAGKGQSGYYGNPHVIGWCQICKRNHSREECIEAFREDFNKRIREDPTFKVKVESLRGKRLGCFCAPAKCHGDVYVEYLEANAPRCDRCGNPLTDSEIGDHNSAPLTDCVCYACEPERKSDIQAFHNDMNPNFTIECPECESSFLLHDADPPTGDGWVACPHCFHSNRVPDHGIHRPAIAIENPITWEKNVDNTKIMTFEKGSVLLQQGNNLITLTPEQALTLHRMIEWNANQSLPSITNGLRTRPVREMDATMTTEEIGGL